MNSELLSQPLHLEGDIDLHLAEGLDARLTSLSLVDHAAEGAPLTLSLSGRIGELRKIARFVPSVRALLRQAEDATDDEAARLTLQAHEAHRERLVAPVRRAAPARADLPADPDWMAALLDLERYTPERLDLVKP